MKLDFSGAALQIVLIAQLTIATTAASAQQFAASNNSNGNNSVSSGTAPVYSQRNFDCDARAENLYSYKNPVSQMQQPWNTYELQVQQLAAQAAFTAAVQPPKMTQSTTGLTTPTAGFGSMMNHFASLSSSLLKSGPNPNGSTSGAYASNLGPGTGESSSFIPGVSRSNGLAGAPSSPSESRSSQLQGASKSVSGKLQQAESESIPGLLSP